MRDSRKASSGVNFTSASAGEAGRHAQQARNAAQTRDQDSFEQLREAFDGGRDSRIERVLRQIDHHFGEQRSFSDVAAVEGLASRFRHAANLRRRVFDARAGSDFAGLDVARLDRRLPEPSSRAPAERSASANSPIE